MSFRCVTVLLSIFILCMSNQECEHHAAIDWDPAKLELHCGGIIRLQNISPLQTRALKTQSRNVYVQNLMFS